MHSSEYNITVEGLQPNTAYNFYLSVANAVGVGKAIKFRVKTPNIPPDSKHNLNINRCNAERRMS